MSGRYARILTAGCAGVLGAALVAGTAVAATTWTVRPGGPVSMKPATLILTDTKTGTTETCLSVRMRGTLKSGSGLPGTGIGSIASVNLTGCASGLPPQPGMTATDLPWHVNVTSYNATKGVVTGSVSHIQIKIKSTKLRCVAVVDGTSATASDGIVTFTYTDSTGSFKVLTSGSNLHLYRVRGCAGLLRSGDPVTLSATFTVSPAQTITSP